MIDYQKEARGLIEGRVLFEVPMRKYTSLKVGGPAECLLFPKNTKELRKVILHARRKRIPLFILGKGTNLIVRDRGMSGWVVSLTQGMKRIRMDGECLEAEAGCSLQQLVQFSVQKGLSGLEPFFGIPGTVGGGLAMNAGAWGVEMKDVVDSVTWMKENGEVVERLRSKLQFSYRSLTLPSSNEVHGEDIGEVIRACRLKAPRVQCRRQGRWQVGLDIVPVGRDTRLGQNQAIIDVSHFVPSYVLGQPFQLPRWQAR